MAVSRKGRQARPSPPAVTGGKEGPQDTGKPANGKKVGKHATAASAKGGLSGAARLESLPRDMEARRLKGKGPDYMVAGVDEAGRGPCAGPVVAAAVVIPPGVSIQGVNDSKKLSEEERERLFEELTGGHHEGVRWACKAVGHEEIDRINILQAAMKAMRECVEELSPNHAFIDGPYVPTGISKRTTCQAVVKGDSKCYSIAAASIIAKVTRDRIMCELDEEFPAYGFARHKGYETPEHLAALDRHGPCFVHRATYKPVRLAADRMAARAAAKVAKVAKVAVAGGSIGVGRAGKRNARKVALAGLAGASDGGKGKSKEVGSGAVRRRAGSSSRVAAESTTRVLRSHAKSVR